MGKRCRSPDSDSEGTTPEAPKYNTVFIDTNIDTHLALIMSDSQTIADLKDQIVLEHGQFFPEIGVVKVHTVKVKRKRREFFYHLPDYMPVKCAFEEDSKSCFFYVDVSKCSDVPQIVNDGASNQRGVTTANLLVHDQGRLDDCFKVPRAVDGVQVADVQNRSSSNPVYSIPASNQEFKDGNVPNDVNNHGSYSSGQSVKTCNSAKRLKRKCNSLVATSISKDKNMSSQALCGSFETGFVAVNTQNNKADKLIGSHAHKKPGESTPPSALSDTKEVNAHKKRSKKNAKSSKSKILDDHDDQVRNLMVDSHLALPDTADQELPESAKFEKGRLILGKHDVIAAGVVGPSGINHLHADKLNIDNKNKTEERKLPTVDDPEMMQTEELDLLHCNSTVPSASLVTKEAKTHKKSMKKGSKISRSGVQDEHVDRPGLQDVVVSDHNCYESTIKEGNCSSKADVRAVEQNLLTKTVDTHEGTEGLNCGGEKKKKVRKSGASTKDQQNQESVIAENDLNLEQVRETKLSSNSDCPDVPNSLDVNEATEDGKATHEKKEEAEKAVARVQETGDMNRDADQINDVEAVEQNLLTKTVDTGEATEGVTCGGRKKKKKVLESGVGAIDQQNRQSIVAENYLNLEQVPETQLSSNSDCPDVPMALEVNEDGKSTDENKKKQSSVAKVQDTGDMNRDADQINDVEAVEQNLLTKTVDTGEATEGVTCGGRKKKKKVLESGVGAIDQQNRQSIVAENYLNLEQVPETQLSSNSDCPDVPMALEVNEDGKSTDENKKKQSSVAKVQDTGDMNRDADQINDVRAMEQNISTKTVAPEALEGGGGKKKKKVRKSGAAPKDQENRGSIDADQINDVRAMEQNLSTKTVAPETVDGGGEKKKKNVRKSGAAPKDQENRESIDAYQINDVRAMEPNLSTKTVASEAVDGGGEKKKKKVRKSGAAPKDQENRESIDADQINDVRAMEQNLSTKTVAAEAIDGGGEKKKKKVRKSGAAPKDQENRESIVVENDLNLEQVPEKGLSTNSGCPDVPKALEGTEATEDGKAIYENKKKQKAEKAVAGVLDTGDMNRDADQINNMVFPSVDSPKQDDLMPPSQNDETYQKIEEERDLLVNNNFAEVAECFGKDISFKQYFVPSHPQDEVTTEQSAGSVAKKKRKEDVRSVAKKKRKEDVRSVAKKKRKEDVPSTVSSPKLLPESTKKDGIISSAGKANDLAESNKLTETKNKIGKHAVPYAMTSSDLDEFRTPSKPVSSAFLNGSDATKTVPSKKETVQSLAASGVNSNSKTYGKAPLKSNTRDRKESRLGPHVTTGKNSSSKRDGGVMNKSKQEKSLGQTPKSIFRDISSESSSGENGSVDSSASTGPPSDLSYSSDSSEDAATTGDSGKVKDGVKKGVSNSEISDQEHIPISLILRSSSRFKKAMDKASQDPDSQLDEFLPETETL